MTNLPFREAVWAARLISPQRGVLDAETPPALTDGAPLALSGWLPEPILAKIRSAQWLWDYSIASHGSFFHAPDEALRLLGVANDKAKDAQLDLVTLLAKYDVVDADWIREATEKGQLTDEFVLGLEEHASYLD